MSEQCTMKRSSIALLILSFVTWPVLAGDAPPPSDSAAEQFEALLTEFEETGGAAQFMAGYQDPDNPEGPIGLSAFLDRADELAEKYGDRFRATPWLRERAAKGEGFPA